MSVCGTSRPPPHRTANDAIGATTDIGRRCGLDGSVAITPERTSVGRYPVSQRSVMLILKLSAAGYLAWPIRLG